MPEWVYAYVYSETGLYILSLVSATFRMTIPLAFAALGATFSERVGVVNIGLEGLMLFGAFFGVYGAYITGSSLAGVLIGVGAAAFFGLLFGLVTVKLKTDQIVAGVALNLLALGLTTVLLGAIWGNRGKSDEVMWVKPWSWRAIRDIPVLGDLFGRMTPFFYLLLVVVALSWLLLFKTRWGLRIRGIGEHPEAADALGIAVERYQLIFVTLSGALAGLGGVYLSLGELGLFGRNMTAGRGFIALAANILGNWNPLGALGSSMLFGFASALQMRLQGMGIPTQFIQMLPYLLTIIVLAGIVKKVRVPAAAGRHFKRGETQ